MAIRIITDSTSDYPLQVAAEKGIEIVPLKVNFGTQEFVDKYGITNQEFYRRLADSKTLPTTTLVNPQQFMDTFQKYPNDDLIVILVSSKLSGTFQSALIAKDELQRDNITVIDSETVTIGIILLVNKALEMRDAGATAIQIADEINQRKKKVNIVVVLDTLKYLVKGGRLSGSVGVIGGMLGLRPILRVNDGEILSVGKGRGVKKALTEAMRIIQSISMDIAQPMCYAYSGESANGLPELMREMNAPETAEVYQIGSVVGSHAGPGAFAIAFMQK